MPGDAAAAASTITLDAEQRARAEQQLARMEEWERVAEREGEGAAHLRHLEPSDILRAAHAVRDAITRPGGSSPEALEDLRRRQCALAAQYPVLFDKCCDPGFPLGMLPVLLSHLDRFRSKQASHKGATDDVCDALNRRFVDPVLETLPTPPSVNAPSPP